MSAPSCLLTGQRWLPRSPVRTLRHSVFGSSVGGQCLMTRPFDIWLRLTISGDSLSWLSTRPIAGLGSRVMRAGQTKISWRSPSPSTRTGVGWVGAPIAQDLGRGGRYPRYPPAGRCLLRGEPRRRGSPAVLWPSLSHSGDARRCRGAARTAAYRVDQPGRSTAGVEVVDDLGVVFVNDGSFDLHRGSALPGLGRQVMGQHPELADAFGV